MVLKILIGIYALLMGYLGVAAMLDPAGVAPQYGLDPLGALGLSTIRGDIAGLFLASAVMLVVGLVRRETLWFLAVALLMVLIAIGRGVGMALDGLVEQAQTAFIVELVSAGILIWAHRRATTQN